MTTREILNSLKREEGIALYNSRKTDKEAYDLFVSKGLTDDFETFVSEAKNLFIEKVSAMSKEELLTQIEGAELTDEQLEMIAGGDKSGGQTAGIAISGAAGAGVVGLGIWLAYDLITLATAGGAV